MLRNLLIGITLVAAGAVAGLSVSASGQDAVAVGTQGPARAGLSVEGFRMPTRVTQKGVPSRDGRLVEKRALLAVPSHYGTLYAITGHGDAAVFWYQDETGAIRNAVVGDAAGRLQRVVTHRSERLEYDFK